MSKLQRELQVRRLHRGLRLHDAGRARGRAAEPPSRLVQLLEQRDRRPHQPRRPAGSPRSTSSSPVASTSCPRSRADPTVSVCRVYTAWHRRVPAKVTLGVRARVSTLTAGSASSATPTATAGSSPVAGSSRASRSWRPSPGSSGRRRASRCPSAPAGCSACTPASPRRRATTSSCTCSTTGSACERAHPRSPRSVLPARGTARRDLGGDEPPGAGVDDRGAARQPVVTWWTRDLRGRRRR